MPLKVMLDIHTIDILVKGAAAKIAEIWGGDIFVRFEHLCLRATSGYIYAVERVAQMIKERDIDLNPLQLLY